MPRLYALPDFGVPARQLGPQRLVGQHDAILGVRDAE
jgi:hypothetical protein